MADNSEQGGASRAERKPEAEKSPSEKLEEIRPTGSLVPGAENPESREIKKEVNPNTE